MTLQIAKSGIDFGTVTNNRDAMLHFYGEVLSLPEMPRATLPGVTTYKFQCGDSVIKIVTLDDVETAQLEAAPLPEGIFQQTGIRYVTISVDDINNVIGFCREAGVDIALDRTEIRPQVYVSLIADPDGNSIELLENNEVSAVSA